MAPSDASSAFDRLREVLRPPEPFAPRSSAPPAALLRASPREPGGLSRFDPGVPGARVLILVGMAAALIAGGYLWWSRPAPQPVPSAVVRSAEPAPRAAVPAVLPTPSPSASPALIVVDVAGKVRHPGVVSLSPGARVIDAIEAAGGVRAGAETGMLNLARHVADGEQILVGLPQSSAPTVVPPAASSAPAQPSAPLDLNTATATQLDQLPGVGPVLAQRIVDYRVQHGGFRSVDELRQVSGIGPAKFADLKGLVTV